MKSLYCIIFILLVAKIVVAQDYIILKTGDEIKSKVTEITINEIKYKKFENLDGPTISIDKSTVFMIKYKNGTKDIINPIIENVQTVKPVTEPEKNEKTVSNTLSNDKTIIRSKRNSFASLGLSFLVPGLGQIYNHQYAKGLIMSLSYSTAITIAASIPLDYYYLDYKGEIYKIYYWPTGKIISLVGAGAIFLWSVIDAPISSSIINRKNGLTSNNNVFENNKFGLNIQPHTDLVFVNTKQSPIFGAKLTMSIK